MRTSGAGKRGWPRGNAGYFAHLLLRFLADRPWRALVMLLALSAVLAVVLVLEGFRNGLERQLRETVLERGAPLIAVQAGVDNFLAVRSSIPQQARLKVEDLPAVTSAAPLTLVPVIFEHRGATMPIVVMVTDGVGGPRRLAAGTAGLGGGRIVVDESLAAEFGIALGDAVALNGHEFEVAGVARGAAAFFTPFAFIDFDDLIDWFWALDVGADIASFPLVSFLLITPAPGFASADVIARVEAAVPEIDVFEASALAANDASLGRDLLDPILGVLLTVAWVASMLVVGIVMFATVQARLREHIVLDAMGCPSRTTVVMLVGEGVLRTLLALPFALVLALLTAAVVELAAPLYRVAPFETATIVRLLAGATIAAIVGAMAPVHLLRGIDPAAALRR